jgi:hypothetical protein
MIQRLISIKQSFKFHTKSEICGTCHNVKHVVYGTWLETTYRVMCKPYKNQGFNVRIVTCIKDLAILYRFNKERKKSREAA